MTKYFAFTSNGKYHEMDTDDPVDVAIAFQTKNRDNTNTIHVFELAGKRSFNVKQDWVATEVGNGGN